MSAVLWSKFSQKEAFSVKPLVFTTQDWVWSLYSVESLLWGITSNARQVLRTHAEFLKASLQVAKLKWVPKRDAIIVTLRHKPAVEQGNTFWQK